MDVDFRLLLFLPVFSVALEDMRSSEGHDFSWYTAMVMFISFMA
jgi:hypothetical protein